MLTSTTLPISASGQITEVRSQIAESDDPLDLIGARVNYSCDNDIYYEGEPAEFVYRVVSGVVRVSKCLADGRRQISAFYMPGDMFGFEGDATHAFTAEAIADSVVQVFKRSSLTRLADTDAAVAHAILQATTNDLCRAQAHMLLLGRKTALERIVAFLLEMATRAKTGHLVRLLMSRYDIADHLGLTIETVSRTLSQLETEDLIELLSARKIILKNPAALARLTG